MTQLLHGILESYIYPILEFSDNYVGEDGRIRPNGSDSVYKFENKKYQKSTKLVPEYFIPTVIQTDNDYLEVKSTPGLEVFNPFVNLKHMNLVALLVKNKLRDYAIEEDDDELITDEELNEVDDDEPIDLNSYKFQEEDVSFFSINEPTGELSLVFTYNKDHNNPKELAKVTGSDPLYLTWALCIKVMERYKDVIPPQFKDLEKSWNKIISVIKDWDRYRKTIFKVVKESKEIDATFEDIDFSDIQNPLISEFVDEDKIDDYLFEKYGQMKLNPDELIDFSDQTQKSHKVITQPYYEQIDFS